MADRYAHLREFYADFATSEDDARIVAWRCRDDQILRLEVLLEALDDADWPLSVLDVGCGLGALYDHLERTGRLGDYQGLDLLDTMVEGARARHPKGRFEVADLLTWERKDVFDVVLCSGSLNVTVLAHERWIERMLEAMWTRARLAVLVNFQWTRAFQTNPVSAYDEDIYHVDRARILGVAEKLTPWLVMRQDYLGDDLALYLYKDYHRSARRLLRARDADPRGDAERACGLAFLLLERKLPREALTVLEQIEKPTAMVYNYIGLCHHKLGDLRKARTSYALAVTYDPSLTEARLNLDWIVKNG
jgi:SAM-dependent methyltransferase